MPDSIPAGTLVYGMQLPVQSQSTIYAEAWEAAAGVAELADITRAADRSGFLRGGRGGHDFGLRRGGFAGRIALVFDKA